eukprot:364523-Chlamydomonas_euryale.AAC.2
MHSRLHALHFRERQDSHCHPPIPSRSPVCCSERATRPGTVDPGAGQAQAGQQPLVQGRPGQPAAASLTHRRSPPCCPTTAQVLNVAYIIVAAFCTIIGGLGYYMYGQGAADVVIFNLPAGFLATLCCSMVLINPIAKVWGGRTRGALHILFSPGR